MPKNCVSIWRQAWNRLCRPNKPTPSFNLEGLESRVVMSTGPALTGVELLGPVSAVNAVVLTFNESLNPTTAQTLATYAFGRPPVSAKSDNGLSLSDFLPFREVGHMKPARQVLIRAGKIIFSSAVYNDATHTVTLTPLAPFKATAFFRFLRLKGIGPNAIEDDNGIRLNGGLDAVARWSVHQGKIIRYVDAAHDIVTFKLKGPGKLVLFRRVGKDSSPTIFIQGATSATTLTGTVTNKRIFQPSINVAQIQGAETVSNNLLNNPSFNVAVTTP